jgi:hypothetical protein
MEPSHWNSQPNFRIVRFATRVPLYRKTISPPSSARKDTTASETTTVLTSMVAKAMPTNPEAAPVAEEPTVILRQHLATILAGDVTDTHVGSSSTR